MMVGNTQRLEDQFHLGSDEIQRTLSQATDPLKETQHTLPSNTNQLQVVFQCLLF